MVSQKVEIQKNLSFRRRPESSYFNKFWTPAFAGVTFQETFYETFKIAKCKMQISRKTIHFSFCNLQFLLAGFANG